jgi:hypothetical protein
MRVAKCVSRTTFVAFTSMPLLTALGSSEDGFCYRHDAPSGAFSRPDSREDNTVPAGRTCTSSQREAVESPNRPSPLPSPLRKGRGRSVGRSQANLRSGGAG